MCPNPPDVKANHPESLLGRLPNAPTYELSRPGQLGLRRRSAHGQRIRKETPSVAPLNIPTYELHSAHGPNVPKQPEKPNVPTYELFRAPNPHCANGNVQRVKSRWKPIAELVRRAPRGWYVRRTNVRTFARAAPAIQPFKRTSHCAARKSQITDVGTFVRG